MPNVLVRDVPDDIHAALSAAPSGAGSHSSGISWVGFHRLVERPSLDEILDQLDGHSGGSVGLAQAVADIHEERARQ